MSSNTVRAKVLCTQVVPHEIGGGARIYFSAVYSDDPSSENYSFSSATPSLELCMSVSAGTPASPMFERGKEYYLDFSSVSPVVDPRQLTIDSPGQANLRSTEELRDTADGSYRNDRAHVPLPPGEKERFAALADEACADAHAQQVPENSMQTHSGD